MTSLQLREKSRVVICVLVAVKVMMVVVVMANNCAFQLVGREYASDIGWDLERPPNLHVLMSGRTCA